MLTERAGQLKNFVQKRFYSSEGTASKKTKKLVSSDLKREQGEGREGRENRGEEKRKRWEFHTPTVYTSQQGYPCFYIKLDIPQDVCPCLFLSLLHVRGDKKGEDCDSDEDSEKRRLKSQLKGQFLNCDLLKLSTDCSQPYCMKLYIHVYKLVL